MPPDSPILNMHQQDMMTPELEQLYIHLNDVMELLQHQPEDTELYSLFHDISNQIKQIQEKSSFSSTNSQAISPSLNSTPQSDALDTSSLHTRLWEVGEKCCVPCPLPKDNQLYLLPSMIHKLNLSKKEAEVFIITPIDHSLLPCPDYLSSLPHDPKSCSFSHGLSVSFDDILDYHIIEKATFLVGSDVFSKYEDDIWYKAKVMEKELDSRDPYVKVVFQGYGDECLRVDLDQVIPAVLKDNGVIFNKRSNASRSDSDSGNESDLDEDSFSPSYSSSFTQVSLSFGEWEKHTKSIGSKLLHKMGYKKGESLGLRKNGIIEPIQVKVFKQGVSLDYISEEEQQTDAQRRRRKRKKGSQNQSSEADKSTEESDMFSFLNDCMNQSHSSSSRRTNTSSQRHLNEVTSTDLRKKSNAELQKQLVKTQDSMQLVQKEIERVEEARQRNLKREPSIAQNYERKKIRLQEQLKGLQHLEESVKKEMGFAKDKRKMIIF